MKINTTAFLIITLLACYQSKGQTPSLTVNLSKAEKDVSPRLYGLMTEEINYSYDGGLYAELIRNRIFKDDAKVPVNWSAVQEGTAKAVIGLDNKNSINNALTTCLMVEVTATSGRAGIANEGYWGIPIRPQTAYKASFYLKSSQSVNKPLTVGLESSDGKTVYANTLVEIKPGGWQKYNVVLNTSAGLKTAVAGRLVITAATTGTYWFNLVSLFPPTYHGRNNGNRGDIMQLMAELKPSFLRFPGGNFLEGDLVATRFDWKKTLGGLESRPGHPGCWNYRASDGMGLLEFLEWCEDLKMEPLLAVYAGYTLKGDHLEAGPFLKPFVEDALDEIEYVTGDIHTKWGAVRAKNGHPAPFKLHFIEIGNEDGFDKSGSYDGRFTQFYKAITAKYPQIKLISTVGGKDPLGTRFSVTSVSPQVFDEHYYRTAWEMEEDAGHYDNYDRKGPKIFVGEWATREGSPTTNMNAALGDAAWMTGMERNSDQVIMSCYAPLFVNVNPGGMQWKSDLIGYNTLSSYGSPSYYAQKMFSSYLGNKIVPVAGQNIPTQTRQPNKRDSAANIIPKPLPALFYVATKDTRRGILYLKVVNASATSQQVSINLPGTAGIAEQGELIVLSGDSPGDTNSITEPLKIVPQVRPLNDLKSSFLQVFSPYSVNVLKISLK